MPLSDLDIRDLVISAVNASTIALREEHWRDMDAANPPGSVDAWVTRITQEMAT